MIQTITSLTKKFISIKSIANNTKELDKILDLALSYLKGYTIERFECNGAKSVLIYKAKKRPKKFKIILNGHLDVVPGKEDQYVPKIKGNRLYGVGSMDMKANVACLIMVFKEMASKVSYPLGLQLVTDEEIGGNNGTKYQIKKGVKAEFVITGEPTNFDIVHKAKGVLQLKVFTKGKTAHGAYPWRGENAIWKMNEFFNALKKKYPISSDEIWRTTVNVSRIETENQAFNKIPDSCVSQLDVRFIPEEMNTIKKSLRQLLLKKTTFNVIAHEPALLTDKNNEFIKLLKKITQHTVGKTIQLRGAHGSSDARHFAHVNCPGIEFGPIGDGIGSDYEWIDIPSLGEYYQILKKFLFAIKR
ncbi:MAG: M20/M25/M40 family metallo-hydrolase [Candidatus Pacebacteria bacterium]|nr:M20/M25/M40 family metallo-hydrolase [Candidatus Paceibacterota bacterium]